MIAQNWYVDIRKFLHDGFHGTHAALAGPSKSVAPRGEEKPLLLPPAPKKPQWKVEAHADQQFRSGTAIRTSVTLAVADPVPYDEQYVKYKKPFDKFVREHRHRVKTKKWVGSDCGRNAGLLRTADICHVLYSLTCRPADVNEVGPGPR